jgi:hypothetical protein
MKNNNITPASIGSVGRKRSTPMFLPIRFDKGIDNGTKKTIR